MGYSLVKRGFDIAFSLMGLLFLVPFLLAVGVLIKLTSPGPVFFRQERIGLYGKPFKIYKFRTMLTEVYRGREITIGGDRRITGLGRFLRGYKLDEAPQLLNVLRGDMSLVGPRPEVKQFVDLYTQEQLKVLSVRPGITDYASIRYSNEEELLALSQEPEEEYITRIMQDKLAMNLKYIEEMSFLTDIKIIFLTMQKIYFG